MILKKKIVGKNIVLRTALESDAEFILGLRLNPNLNKYIKPVDPSVEKQKLWIKQKQDEPNDYHMIIEDLAEKRLGTIALYAIDFERKTFDWGRWVIAEDAPFYVAIESAILLYDYTFNWLKLEKTDFEVQILNEKVINFHLRFGARFVSSDEKFKYFTFTKEDFEKALKKYKKYHKLKV